MTVWFQSKADGGKRDRREHNFKNRRNEIKYSLRDNDLWY